VRSLSIAIVLIALATVARADTVADLSGEWRCKLDKQDAGIAGRWFSAPLDGSVTIKLPGTTDEAGFGERTVGAETGVLTRVVKYYGPAWYQRTIEIRPDWRNKSVELFLERVIWESRAWVDGKPCDAQESLNTPHLHKLGRLRPGKHTLTVRIDNRPRYPIGVCGHSYTEQTQTVWNGAVGRVELQAHDAVEIAKTRVFPRADEKKVEVEVTLASVAAAARPGTLTLELQRPTTGELVARTQIPCEARPGTTLVRASLVLRNAPVMWDEFSPQLYALAATIRAGDSMDCDRQTFGFRDVARVGQHIAINGRPVFLRGNLDCVHFPLTGYPAMDVAGWTRIFQIYQAHGLNHVRFHTWTPPEAAFTAADRLGIYIQCEVVWTQRPLGRDKPGRMEAMPGLGSFPESLMNPPGTVDRYVPAEMRRIIDAYGNHPSFVMLAIGNEMGSYDPQVCGGWIQEMKGYDPRRFYAVSTARRIAPQDDYSVTHAIPKVGWCRDRIEPGNDWDYEKLYAKAPVPIIAHEVGQWPTYPVWDEIAKYRGVLRARNFEQFRALARQHGVEQCDKEFRAASGALAMRLYKDQIESHLRTPSCAGFDLLSMQDFSGQGEALVGWLDSFYDSKGIVEPQRFRRWCNETVPLARLQKCILTSDETLTARIDVAHYGAKALADAKASWQLTAGDGAVLDRGELPAATLAPSTVATLGTLAVKLERCPAPCRARLEVRLAGTPFANDWDVWIFPRAKEIQKRSSEPGGIEVCDTLDGTLAKLRAGKKVLLDAHKLGSKDNANYARFRPAYWSAKMFAGQYTLGALVKADHPALAAFPTQNHFDWQWEELCRNARAFRLDGLPLEYQPIVQPICDFHFNWKLGSLFELRGPQGGALLVCGYDISDNLANRPAARQLRESLLAYMNSSRFAPQTTVDESRLAKLIPAPPVKSPPAGPRPRRGPSRA
jgi:beta-galactosidase